MDRPAARRARRDRAEARRARRRHRRIRHGPDERRARRPPRPGRHLPRPRRRRLPRDCRPSPPASRRTTTFPPRRRYVCRFSRREPDLPDYMTAKARTTRPRRTAPLAIPASPDRRRFRDRLLAWYRRHGRDLPWRKTSDPYHILVSEVMLQQTQVDRVLPKYVEWLEKYPSLEALATAPEHEVAATWYPLGYN